MDDERDIATVEISDEVGQFAETYSSFNKIINSLQRQYLALKNTYTEQSEELQSVNKSLQTLIAENRAVTEFLNSILNALSSGVVAIDKTGCVTHINPAAGNILGLTEARQSYYGRPYEELMRSSEGTECTAPETVRSGRVFESIEKRVESYFGSVLTLSASTSVLRNNRGDIVGAVELFHDISKLKKIEEQLSRMKVLASLGEMAASIAHEIRNPLVGISGFASLLARDLEGDEQKKEMAKKIVAGVNSINKTVQTLLDFARHQKIDKSALDLCAYLKIVLDKFDEEYNWDKSKERIIRENFDSIDISVEVDRQLFRQALVNLIQNGLEAGGDNGQVRIRCITMPMEKAQKEYQSRLELSGTETLVRIEIEDNGPGIPAEDIDKIFSPFYSTKENGIGLGLAIAWKIIKAHGGDISAESPAGKGTKFTIILPARPGC